MRGNKALAGALSAITAAVVGVVLNLAIWFAIHTVFREVQPLSGLWRRLRRAGAGQHRSLGVRRSSLAAAIAIFRFKVGMIPVLAACSAAGIASPPCRGRFDEISSI